MKKGLKTLISGILLILIGTLVIPLAFILPFFSDNSVDERFLVPGEAEVTIEEPGRYYLWNEYQTFFEGKSYQRSTEIPDGLEITITGPHGRLLEFTGNTSFTSSFGDDSKKSIGYVEVDQPGTLHVSVSGEFHPMVFSVAPSNILKLLGLLFAGVGLCILVSTTGLGLLIWGLVKLCQTPKPTRE